MTRGDADVAVVGSGIAGASVARFLAKGGRRVVLIDRDADPAERARGRATTASLGVLNLPKTVRSPLGRLHALGVDLWPRWAAALREETGIDPGFASCGGLHLFRDAPRPVVEERLVRRYREAGFRAEWLAESELRASLPPPLARFAAALQLPEESRVDPSGALRALLASCRRHGVHFHPATAVEAVVPGAPPALRFAGGGMLRCRAIVVAAGAWSSGLLDEAQRGKEIAIRPVRGQALALRTDLPAGPTLHFEVPGVRRAYYLLPRGGGRAWFGATVEERSGFASDVTPQGRAELVAAARALLPDLRDEDIVDSWAGLRPQAGRRGGPFLGPLPEAHGVWLACGHYRTGVLAAPATAELVGRALLGRPHAGERELLAAFGPE